MWRVKRLADPRRRARPRDRAHRGRRRAPAQPQVRAARSSRVARPVHRVRLLRAGVPEPRPDDDARASGSSLRREMARQPEGSPVLEALLERVRLRRHRDMRGRRPVQPARARSGSTPGKLVKGLRARRARRGAERGALSRSRGAGERVERAARGALRDRPRRSATARLARADRHRAQRRLAGADPRVGARRCPDPRRALPLDRARGGGRRLLPGVREPHLRQPARARAAALAARGAADRLRARRAAAVDPARRRRAAAAARRGARRASRTGSARWRAAPPPPCSSGPSEGGAAARRGRELLHARPARRGARAARRGAGASAYSAVRDPRLDRVGRASCSDRSTCGASSARSPSIPRARPATWASPGDLAELAGALGGATCSRRSGRAAAAPRATAACCIPSCRAAARPLGARPSAAARPPTRTSAATAPARSASPPPPGEEHGSFVLLLEELTRPGAGRGQ